MCPSCRLAYQFGAWLLYELEGGVAPWAAVLLLPKGMTGITPPPLLPLLEFEAGADAGAARGVLSGGGKIPLPFVPGWGVGATWGVMERPADCTDLAPGAGPGAVALLRVALATGVAAGAGAGLPLLLPGGSDGGIIRGVGPWEALEGAAGCGAGVRTPVEALPEGVPRGDGAGAVRLLLELLAGWGAGTVALLANTGAVGEGAGVV